MHKLLKVHQLPLLRCASIILLPACTIWLCIASAVGGGSSQRIVLRRLDVTARLQDRGILSTAASPADRARSFWRDMLEEHAAHSSLDQTAAGEDVADAAAAGAPVPQWSLKCSREHQLQQLCLRFTTRCTEYLERVSFSVSLHSYIECCLMKLVSNI